MFLIHLIPKQFRASNWLIKKRQSICNKCIHRVKSTGSCGPLVIGINVEHENKKTHLCGCITNEKSVLKNQHCDLGKW